MSDLTPMELYNHQMVVYGDSEFNTPTLTEKKECDTCHRTLVIRTNKTACISCRAEQKKQQALQEITESGAINYPNITSFSQMNNYLGI